MNEGLQYIELYKQARGIICEHSAEVMNTVRDKAFNAFATGGFPTRKAERYKYTDIAALFAPDYGLNLNRYNIPVNPYDAFKCDVPNLSTLLYFVVNDAFYGREARVEGREAKVEPTPNPSRTGVEHGSRVEGAFIGSLKEFAEKEPTLVGRYYAKIARTDSDAVTALNTMLAQDGLLVYVPKNVKMEKTVQVINILKAPSLAGRAGGESSFMVNRRVLIIMEEGAEAKLLFCDHTADDSLFLTTQVVEAFVGDNAHLDLYCMEETHAKNIRISNVYIDQQRNSRVNHNVITLHNGVTRNQLDLTLSGEGAECSCDGCVIADKQQHVDNNTVVTHHACHCTSRELYKYVLNDQSVGAFAGRILVEPGAQKTDSQMTNQNLCATKEARMFTQPMLEIYADDVKCAHGSTVGQLNDAALFYMQQRGIALDEAKLLLQNAFINEVVDKIELIPLRDRLRYLVEKRFRGELSKCQGCKLCR